jgi:hypothetical protein
MSNKINGLLLAAAAATASVPAHAKDCEPGTFGYVSGFFSNACVVTLESPKMPLSMQAQYWRAAVNGQDTGKLRTPWMQNTIQSVYNQVQSQLDSAIEGIDGSRVMESVPTVNLSGTIVATASPDINISTNLKGIGNNAKVSPALALYRATPESMMTAHKRCNELLQALPTSTKVNWTQFTITTNWLSCKAEVKPLNIDIWAAKLTKVTLELEKLWIIWSDTDDGQITAITYANNPAKIPEKLSPESRQIIVDLAHELDAIRTIDINGTMQATVLVNKQEVNIGNIIGTITWTAAIVALAMWYLRRKNKQGSYAAHKTVHA